MRELKKGQHQGEKFVFKIDGDIGEPAATLTAGSSAYALTYYGGPVLQNAAVYVIYWGGRSKISLASQIEGFYAAATTSEWYKVMSQYSTTSPAQKLGYGSLIGSYSYANAPTTGVNGTLIGSTLKSFIINGIVPPPTANSYYVFHFAPGITVNALGSDSCVYWCAYHDTLSYSGMKIAYGVMPHMGNSGCNGGRCGGRSNLFESTTVVSSHELAEAVTDPAVGLANVYGPPLGWYNYYNGEIGDICNAQTSTITAKDGTSYAIQKIYSNIDGACVVSSPKLTDPPTKTPTTSPTNAPTKTPTTSPTNAPTTSPTSKPTTLKPTISPTAKATTAKPTGKPS